ncbi:MAG: alpha/beta fold hydrolase [Marmoricola sp.]
MTQAKAVLHIHGFADYFFQTVAADFWVAHGYDFYAIDLRKYGRSLLAHQTPNFTNHLSAYYEELDLAWAEISQDHSQIVVSGHSTGGLIASLVASRPTTRRRRGVLEQPMARLSRRCP